MTSLLRTGGMAALALALAAGVAQAERIANPIARFAGLDKITGLTTTFEVKVNEEIRFGRLVVKPFSCYTRPITEEPRTDSFVQVDLLDAQDRRKRIFSGWMFAESPGLNAVEDPTFDVWLTGCFDPNAPPPPVEVPQTPETQVEEEDTGGTEPASPAD